LRVFGGNGDLGSVCTQHEIDEVVISSMKMTEERVEEVLRTCAERQIKVKRMRITMEDLTSVDDVYYARKGAKVQSD
ncbi:MAG TPA: hypothetical protein VFT26_10605, partial [Pyrinomonadaceae bacterium]|nr:hypothetical protein [Pyrinomonadaceae bacterium]